MINEQKKDKPDNFRYDLSGFRGSKR